MLTFANTQLMLALAASSRRLPSPVELSLSPPLQQRTVSGQVLLSGEAAARAECFEHGHTRVQCLFSLRPFAAKATKLHRPFVVRARLT